MLLLLCTDAKVLQPHFLVAVPSLLRELQVKWNDKMEEEICKDDDPEEKRKMIPRAFAVQTARWRRGINLNGERTYWWGDEIFSKFKDVLGGAIKVIGTGHLPGIAAAAYACMHAASPLIRPHLCRRCTNVGRAL